MSKKPLNINQYKNSSVRLVISLAAHLPNVTVRSYDRSCQIHCDDFTTLTYGTDAGMRHGKFRGDLRKLLNVTPPGFVINVESIVTAARCKQNDVKVLEQLMKLCGLVPMPDDDLVIEGDTTCEREPDSVSAPTPADPDRTYQYYQVPVGHGPSSYPSPIAVLRVWSDPGMESQLVCSYLDCEYEGPTLRSVNAHHRIHGASAEATRKASIPLPESPRPKKPDWIEQPKKTTGPKQELMETARNPTPNGNTDDSREILKKIHKLVAPSIEEELYELRESKKALQVFVRNLTAERDGFREESAKLRADLSTIKELLP